MLQLQNSAIAWGPVVQAREPEVTFHTQMITASKKKIFFLHFLYFFPCNSCYIFDGIVPVQFKWIWTCGLSWCGAFQQLEAGDVDGRATLVFSAQCSWVSVSVRVDPHSGERTQTGTEATGDQGPPGVICSFSLHFYIPKHLFFNLSNSGSIL